MRICICDDELEELEKTTALAKDFFNRLNIEYQIDTFSNAKVLLNKLEYFYEEANYDIYLLDIIMQVEGIDVARKIKEKNEDAIIIFVTTSKDFAVEAFAIHANDYIVKPVKADDFVDKMNNVLKVMKTRTKSSFAFKTDEHNLRTIAIDSIVYIESANRRMILHLNTFEEVYSPVLRMRFHEAIPFDYVNHNFFQCHSSYVVNLNEIKNITKNGFIMNTDEFVPISKQYYQEARHRYISYLTGEQE